VTAQSSALAAMQANMNARNNLLATGVRMVKPMQAVTGAVGSQMMIPLDRSGILTAVELHVSLDVTVSATLTASGVAPYNLLRSVKYTDFAGVDRTLVSGPILYALDCVRNQTLYGNAPTGFRDTTLSLLNTPVETGTLEFIVRIPVAYSETDLTGAVLAQTAVGQHYVTIQLAPALVGSDPWLYPYTAGTETAGNNVSVTAYMEYIQPQGLLGLPVLDLSTIYGVEGNYTTSDNLSSGQDKYLNYPNMRSVLSAIFAYDNAALNPGTDISRIRVVANSNVQIMDGTPEYYLNKVRNALKGDLPAGLYYLGSRMNPINTTLYGNVQLAFTPSDVQSGAYVPYAFEVKYPSGQPLPGIAQG
jgi:hypothetical protein